MSFLLPICPCCHVCRQKPCRVSEGIPSICEIKSKHKCLPPNTLYCKLILFAVLITCIIRDPISEFLGSYQAVANNVMYFYGSGLLCIRLSSGTHHVVKLFEISYMLVQTTSLSLKVFFRVH